MISTDVNATSIVFNKNSLPTNSKLCLMLFVTPQEGKINFAVLEFYTDGEPHGGYCNQSVTEGISLETEFSFECSGWQDESTPISYEFRLGDDPISYGFSFKSVSTVLPAGSQEDDYQQQINIVIKNSASVAVVETLNIKVTESFAVFLFFFCLEQPSGREILQAPTRQAERHWYKQFIYNFIDRTIMASVKQAFSFPISLHLHLPFK